MKKILIFLLVFAIFGCSSMEKNSVKKYEVNLLNEESKNFYRNITEKDTHDKKYFSKLVEILAKRKILKDEFEKNNEYINRFNVEVKDLCETEYFSLKLSPSIKYNVEYERFELELESYITVTLSEKRVLLGSYIGTNSFGVSRKVKNYKAEKYYLHRTASTFFGKKDDILGEKLFLNIPLNLAKNMDKNKIITSIVFKPFYNTSDSSIAHIEKYYQGPTLSEPISVEETAYCMNIVILYVQVKYEDQILFEAQPLEIDKYFYSMPEEIKNKLTEKTNVIRSSYNEYYLMDLKGNILDYNEKKSY